MSKCNCHSYNWDIGTKPEVQIEDERGAIIDIDACIADVIKHLWDNDVFTTASCCGHGRKEPSIIIKDDATIEQAERIEELISKVDKRKFNIFSWRLTLLN